LIDYQALSTLHHLQKLCNLVGVTSSEVEEEGEKDDGGHLDFRANIRKFNALLAQTPKYQALLTLVADSLPNIPTTEVGYLSFLYLRYRYSVGSWYHTCHFCTLGTVLVPYLPFLFLRYSVGTIPANSVP
jgi:hypothetical protein